MNSINTIIKQAFLLALFLFASIGCSEDPAPAPVEINFTNTSSGISSTQLESEISITFSRPAESAGSLAFSLSNTDLQYGENQDFSTIPAAVNNAITVGYRKGESTVSLSVKAGSALNISEDQSVTITLVSGELMQVGNQKEHTVLFSENFVALEGNGDLDAGGENFTHQSYFDLSKLKSHSINKYSWDLGFYTGAEKRVILNSSAFAMARKLEKTDLNSVTEADTIGFAAVMTIPNYSAASGAAQWVDAPDGDLSNTAIDPIVSTENDNKVYIIKRDGEGRNWKKIRVLQEGDGYVMQYADIDATNFETISITNNSTHSFSYIDLDQGEVSIAPEKHLWDIQYGTHTEILNYGGEIPYGYKDYILINRHNTSVAEVLTEDIAYDSFDASNIEAQTFDNTINSIGSKWRNGGGPGSGPSLKTDRYYVVLDSEGNYYKLKFLSMTSDSGERGHASIQFKQVQ